MSKCSGARWLLVFALSVGAACGDDAKSGDSGGECTSTFKACGGDLVGSWQYTGACFSDLPAALTEGEAAMFDKCDDKPVLDLDFTLTGQAEFGEDGSFSTDQKVSLTGGLRVSKACLAQVAESAGLAELTCADIEGTSVSGGCLVGFGDGESQDSELKTSGTYSVSGNELTVTSDDADPNEKSEATPYCVRGDTLTARIKLGDIGASIVYTAKRK